MMASIKPVARGSRTMVCASSVGVAISFVAIIYLCSPYLYRLFLPIEPPYEAVKVALQHCQSEMEQARVQAIEFKAECKAAAESTKREHQAALEVNKEDSLACLQQLEAVKAKQPELEAELLSHHQQQQQQQYLQQRHELLVYLVTVLAAFVSVLVLLLRTCQRVERFRRFAAELQVISLRHQSRIFQRILARTLTRAYFILKRFKSKLITAAQLQSATEGKVQQLEAGAQKQKEYKSALEAAELKLNEVKQENIRLNKLIEENRLEQEDKQLRLDSQESLEDRSLPTWDRLDKLLGKASHDHSDQSFSVWKPAIEVKHITLPDADHKFTYPLHFVINPAGYKLDAATTNSRKNSESHDTTRGRSIDLAVEIPTSAGVSLSASVNYGRNRSSASSSGDSGDQTLKMRHRHLYSLEWQRVRQQGLKPGDHGNGCPLYSIITEKHDALHPAFATKLQAVLDKYKIYEKSKTVSAPVTPSSMRPSAHSGGRSMLGTGTSSPTPPMVPLARRASLPSEPSVTALSMLHAAARPSNDLASATVSPPVVTHIVDEAEEIPTAPILKQSKSHDILPQPAPMVDLIATPSVHHARVSSLNPTVPHWDSPWPSPNGVRPHASHPSKRHLLSSEQLELQHALTSLFNYGTRVCTGVTLGAEENDEHESDSADGEETRQESTTTGGSVGVGLPGVASLKIGVKQNKSGNSKEAHQQKHAVQKKATRGNLHATSKHKCVVLDPIYSSITEFFDPTAPLHEVVVQALQAYVGMIFASIDVDAAIASQDFATESGLPMRWYEPVILKAKQVIKRTITQKLKGTPNSENRKMFSNEDLAVICSYIVDPTLKTPNGSSPTLTPGAVAPHQLVFEDLHLDAVLYRDKNNLRDASTRAALATSEPGFTFKLCVGHTVHSANDAYWIRFLGYYGGDSTKYQRKIAHVTRHEPGGLLNFRKNNAD